MQNKIKLKMSFQIIGRTSIVPHSSSMLNQEDLIFKRPYRLQLELRAEKSVVMQDIKNYIQEPQNNAFSSYSSASSSPHKNYVFTAVSTQSGKLAHIARYPSSCAEALYSSRPSGIYRLYLPAEFGLKPFYAYCLQDVQNGSAWTIVQRRQNDLIDFYLGWAEYKRGFGHLNGDFFIGLDYLHALTHAQMHELRIEMEDFEGEKRFAAYDRFAIADESSKYALKILGAFSGDAGDSLTYSVGTRFTTKDAHHDAHKKNCAVIHTGAWWYRNCMYSSLNGQYISGGKLSDDNYSKGIIWHSWHGYDYSLKYVHMAIRPKL